MGYPHGVNLLADTEEVGIGVALAPLTWNFGPVATLNVALTLSPTLSALAMFVLIRRWISWMPAAFFGGLLYGFSPFVLMSLTNAHLMLGMAFIPPLVVARLDELFVRQRQAEATREREAGKRARAIAEARGHGLSLEAIAERLSVSRERVRQMAADTRIGSTGRLK
jgi:hypothetical protein